jgi:hypothetical protein
MDENFRIIHHEPLTRYRTFRCQRREAGMLPETFADTVADSLQMRLRSARADHKEIREGRDSAKIENHDVLSLLVFGQSDTKPN